MRIVVKVHVWTSLSPSRWYRWASATSGAIYSISSTVLTTSCFSFCMYLPTNRWWQSGNNPYYFCQNASLERCNFGEVSHLGFIRGKKFTTRSVVKRSLGTVTWIAMLGEESMATPWPKMAKSKKWKHVQSQKSFRCHSEIMSRWRACLLIFRSSSLQNQTTHHGNFSDESLASASQNC